MMDAADSVRAATGTHRGSEEASVATSSGQGDADAAQTAFSAGCAPVSARLRPSRHLSREAAHGSLVALVCEALRAGPRSLAEKDLFVERHVRELPPSLGLCDGADMLSSPDVVCSLTEAADESK